MPKIEIMRLAQTITDDLYQAVAYYEVLALSGLNSALIERVNNRKIHEGFNVVSEALQLGVITTLCRIWDKTRGTARITEVVSRLRKNTHLLGDQGAFEQWQRDVEKIEKSDELEVLRGFRNVGLAHRSDPNEPDPRSKGNARRVLHGDERHVLEATISVVSRLNDLIGSSDSIDFGHERQDWQSRAAKFWNTV
ncbi:MAG: hypothetical protein WAV18_17015 [Roseiarcus sp.]